jgi:GNAT superfamily N-acetyltransferase
MTNPKISFATKEDLPYIKKFILDLAEYEKLSHTVKMTDEDLAENLFGERPYAECLLARIDDTPVGLALFFPTYSTFEGRPGIHLEDLFVLPEHRGKGAGVALLRKLAQITKERNFRRLEWIVLDWNKPSIDFYDSIEAKPQDEWIIYRLDGQKLENFANS